MDLELLPRPQTFQRPGARGSGMTWDSLCQSSPALRPALTRRGPALFLHLQSGSGHTHCRLLSSAGGDSPPAPVHLPVPGPHSRSVPPQVSATGALLCACISVTRSFHQQALTRCLPCAEHQAKTWGHRDRRYCPLSSVEHSQPSRRDIVPRAGGLLV